MIFIYVFYVDLFIEQTFLMNLIVLSLTYIFSNMEGEKRYIWRTVAALTGAVASAGILVIFSYPFFVVLSAIFVIPLMIRCAFGRQKLHRIIRQTALSWLAVVILNGVATAVEQWSGIKSLTIYVGILVLIISGVLVRMLLKSLKGLSNRMRVVVSHHGKSASCLGLYDSGNHLKMPDTGEAVHIASPELLKKLGVSEIPDRVIPFRALGTEEGRIRVTRMEQMCVFSGEKSVCCKGVWMGCAEDNLLKNMDYQIILNASVRFW